MSCFLSKSLVLFNAEIKKHHSALAAFVLRSVSLGLLDAA